MLAERAHNPQTHDALLQAALGVVRAASEREVIERVAQGASSLGWGAVHIALLDDDRVVGEATVGAEPAGARGTGLDRQDDATNHSGLERSRVIATDNQSARWQDGDLVEVSILGVLGAKLGRVMLAEPRAGSRPAQADLEPLELLADIAARTIEALRRHEGQRLETLGRLAEGVAHDYNNLLTVIQGQAEMAQRLIELTDPAHDAVSNVEQAAQQAGDIVGTLLEYTRSSPPALTTIDLCAFIEEMMGMLGRITPSSIRVTFEAGDVDEAIVRLSPTRFRQMLINLVLNAREAIEGVGEIRLALETPGEGATIRLNVTDNGVGMDRPTLDRVFDRDFSSREGGFGLGLAIVRDIAREHGATVAIDSTPGRGTTISIDLPRCAATTRRAG